APLGTLIDGHDGFLYGTTFGGSTVYRVDVSAQFAYAASVGDAGEFSGPTTPLTEVDGAFYATIGNSLFRLGGTIVTYLHTFGGDGDGNSPRGGLLLASDGNLYGATHYGGSQFGGTIYKYSFPGGYEKIHEFAGSGGTESTYPNGDLVEGAPGDFYGTTEGNLSDDSGSVFHMDGSGAITTLHHLTSDEVQVPRAGPVRAPTGDLYASGYIDPSSGIFSVDTLGTYTTRHSFDAATEGELPDGPMLWAADGMLYGVTPQGGPGGQGTIFRYDGSPTLTVLKEFSGDADGFEPSGGLL